LDKLSFERNNVLCQQNNTFCSWNNAKCNGTATKSKEVRKGRKKERGEAQLTLKNQPQLDAVRDTLSGDAVG
jgi:hypothetical protein